MLVSCFLALCITTCFIFSYRLELLNFKMCITYLLEGKVWEVAGYVSTLSPIGCLLSLPLCSLSLASSTSLLIAGMWHPNHFPSTPQILPTSAQFQCQLYMQSFLTPQSWHCPLPALGVQNLLSGPLMGPSHTWL